MCITPLCACQVWVGLRFLGDNWFWSDGSTVSEQDMLSKCPAQWKFCGAVSKNGTDEWMTRDCSERRNFICASTEVENWTSPETHELDDWLSKRLCNGKFFRSRNGRHNNENHLLFGNIYLPFWVWIMSVSCWLVKISDSVWASFQLEMWSTLIYENVKKKQPVSWHLNKALMRFTFCFLKKEANKLAWLNKRTNGI